MRVTSACETAEKPNQVARCPEGTLTQRERPTDLTHQIRLLDRSLRELRPFQLTRPDEKALAELMQTLHINFPASLANAPLCVVGDPPPCPTFTDSGTGVMAFIHQFGFTGAYTTFSTFEEQTNQMINHGAGWKALTYVIASVVLGLFAVRLGAWLARSPWNT